MWVRLRNDGRKSLLDFKCVGRLNQNKPVDWTAGCAGRTAPTNTDCGANFSAATYLKRCPEALKPSDAQAD